MNRITIVALSVLLTMVVLCCGAYTNRQVVTPVVFAAPVSPWVESGSLTGSQAYPVVGARDYDDVSAIADANCIVWNFGLSRDMPGRKRQFSFELAEDANTVTIALIGFPSARNVDLDGDPNAYEGGVFLGSLALTAGQQVAKHSNVYADTCTATDGAWSFAVMDGAGSNRRTVIEVASDKGYQIIYGIATSLNSARVFAEHRTVQ